MRRALLLDAVIVLAAFLLAGLLAGVVWPMLVEPVTVTRTDVGLFTGEVSLSNRFDNDGWYAVLAAGFGLVLGVALTAWRHTHEVVTILLVAASACLAAWVSATVGSALGPDDPEPALARAEVGATASDVVQVSADAAYLVWPIAAVIGALVVLWSPPGERLLRRRSGSEDPGFQPRSVME